MVLAPQPSGSHAPPAHHLGGGTLAGSRCSCARVTGAFELSWVHEVADNAAIVFATSPAQMELPLLAAELVVRWLW